MIQYECENSTWSNGEPMHRQIVLSDRDECVFCYMLAHAYQRGREDAAAAILELPDQTFKGAAWVGRGMAELAAKG